MFTLLIARSAGNGSKYPLPLMHSIDGAVLTILFKSPDAAMRMITETVLPNDVVYKAPPTNVGRILPNGQT